MAEFEQEHEARMEFEVQGYLLSRPLPVAAMTALLQSEFALARVG